MKKFWLSLTILLILYITPFMICLNEYKTIDKSIKILNSLTSASTNKLQKDRNL